MEQKRIENLLQELSEKTYESAPDELANKIKREIPNNLTLHKGGFNTVRIIIDLRVNRLTAAAAIIITVFLCFFLFGKSQEGRSFIQDAQLFMEYIVQSKKPSQLEGLAKSVGQDEQSNEQIREVFYYGDFDTSADPNALLIHWKVKDPNYRVVFRDLRTKVISPSELIQLQADMLKKLAAK